jgi:hypothetical protein
MPKTNSANQYASLTLPRQGFVVPDVGNGADCGESRPSFLHCKVAEGISSDQKLLDLGEKGVYSKK